MNGLEVTWERYSKEVHERFGPIVEDPMADLKNLKQTSTIKVYQDEFDGLFSKVDITESQAVSMFLGGINNDIAMMVRMFKPRTLSDTYCLENLQEATNESRIKSKPVYTSYKNVASTSSGSYGGDGEDEEFLGEEECLAEEFNLHKAKQLGCDLKATCPLQISMAGGSQLVSQYVCKSFKWKLQGETFVSDFMILPLGGCDMGNNQQLQTEIQRLLEEFNDVFAIPTCLPLNRSLDHRIPLKEGVNAGYALITQPLTALLKKNAFNWSDETTESFYALQQAMVKSLVLALPNFNKEFTIETDAFGYGVGVVLYQEGHPIAFLNSNELVEALKDTWSSDPALKSVILSPQQGHSKNSRLKLVSHFHESPTGGHFGMHAIMKRLAAYFYWKGLKKMILTKVWQDISMDFIEALSLSQNKSVIFMVVDRLSKYTHFIPLSHPYIASHVAQAFLDNVCKLHGLPFTIVSDKDKSDGQTEAVNKYVETYLRCMTGESPKEWTKWLPLAEYWYNTNFYNSIKTTPFEFLYGQTPLIHTSYVAKDSFVELVDRTLRAREQAITMLKFHLKDAQDRMKTYADKKRSEMEFTIGDLVYLKLQPYRQLTLRVHKQYKLSAKFFDQFIVLQKKLAKQGNRAVVYGLIQWTNGSVEDATWEFLTGIEKIFPTFDIDP
nr:retrotransposable element Tf2 [Tanacetum cinerariifolium]